MELYFLARGSLKTSLIKEPYGFLFLLTLKPTLQDEMYNIILFINHKTTNLCLVPLPPLDIALVFAEPKTSVKINNKF